MLPIASFRSQPRSLAELLLVFQALEWVLLSDAAMVDHGAECQLRLFGRHLHHFAATRS